MAGIAFIVLAFGISTIIHVFACLILLKCFRIPAHRIGFGLGPRFFAMRLNRWLVVFHLLVPLGAYVKFSKKRVSRASTIILGLTCPGLANLMTAAVLLGMQATIQTAWAGLSLFFSGAVQPASVGKEAWLHIYDAANQQPVLITTGTVLAVIGAINLLPLAPLSGSQTLFALVRDPARRDEPKRVLFLMYAMLMTVFSLILCWLYALGLAVFAS